MTKQEMIFEYERYAFTNNYIIGLRMSGNWYACTLEDVTADELNEIVVFTQASKSHGATNILRFLPNKATREYIVKRATRVDLVCSVEEMDTEVKAISGNRGNLFEEKIARLYNGLLSKMNAPFYEDGDLTINGVPYQAKIEKATWTTEPTLKRTATLLA